MPTIKIVPGGGSSKVLITGTPGSTMYVGASGAGLFQQVIGSSGGSLVISGQAPGSISIPAGALASDVTITATSVNSENITISGVSNVGAALQLGPEGQTFSQPVTITIEVGTLPAGVSISDLVIYTAAVGSNSFTALPTTVVDPTHISAQVSHFSNFVVTYPTNSGGSGTFADPYVITMDGSETQYTVNFPNGEHGAFFKFTMNPSQMGDAVASGWSGELTGYSKVVQFATRANWTPSLQNGEDVALQLRAEPGAAWSTGNYYDNWSNYQSSDPKTAFLNCRDYRGAASYWGFGGGPANATSLGSQWSSGQYLNIPMFTFASPYYGVSNFSGEWLIYVNCPYFSDGYTGGTVTVMSQIITP
ncbi:hypothetical protein EBZ35_08040 [bacterium]|nr:hypothetical protein [bacterium]